MNQNNPYSLEQALALRRAPRHEIEKKQLHLLKKHLERARRIPFYREVLGQDMQAGISLETVTDLSQLPFTSRDDLDRYAERFGHADSENIRGIGALGMQALALYYGTEESKEGGRAQKEKRRPEFRKMLR